MTPSKLTIPLRKWWWILVGAALVAGVSSVLILRGLDPTYRATATLMVGQTISNPNPTSAEFYLGQQLASIYAAIGQRDPVQGAVRKELGLSELPDYYVRALPNSQLIEVSVVDTNPERARLVANEIANQLIYQGPSNQTQAGQVSFEFINEQLVYLETNIRETQEDIASLQLELADMVSATDIEDAQLQLTGLQEKLSTLQTNYATLLASSRSGATNFIQLWEEAQLPTDPLGPGQAIIVAISMTLGLAIAAGGVYLVEYFDTSLKTTSEIESITGSQVLGSIPSAGEIRDHFESETLPFVLVHPLSHITETFHQIRTGLEYIWGEKPPKTILITGMDVGDGKTTVAINLAASFILTGRRVLLVDADFRKPEVHKRLGLNVGPGFTDAVKHDLSPERVVQNIEARYQVMTNGTETIDPIVFLSSIKFRRELAKIEMESDLAILDGPPLFVTDALLMASKVEAVVLVVKPGQVDSSAATELMRQLHRANANILGVVLNQSDTDQWPRYFDGRVDQYRQAKAKHSLGEMAESDEDTDEKKQKVPPFKDGSK